MVEEVEMGMLGRFATIHNHEAKGSDQNDLDDFHIDKIVSYGKCVKV